MQIMRATTKTWTFGTFVVEKFPFENRPRKTKDLEVREILPVKWIAKCLFKSFNTVAVFFHNPNSFVSIERKKNTN